MKDLLTALSQPLAKEDVELRVGTTSDKGFSLLLYKTARTDVKRLNDTGAIWKNEHIYDDRELLKCVLSVYDVEHKLWIPREDVGTESFTEKEKGQYSDSFKRAGFRWGIGLELYNAPFVWVSWEMRNKKPNNFFGSNLEITEYEVKDGHFTKLTVVYKGKGVVFSMNKQPNTNKPKQPDRTPPPPPRVEELKIPLISKEDVLTIEGLITKTNADKTKFLSVFKVSRLEDIAQPHVAKAIELLNAKLKKVS